MVENKRKEIFTIELSLLRKCDIKSEKLIIFSFINVLSFLGFSMIPFSSHTKEASPANTYLLKINNRSTARRCEMWSTLTIKTSE